MIGWQTPAGFNIDRMFGSIARVLATRVPVVVITIGLSLCVSLADEPASTVTWDDKTLALVSSGEVTRGAALATQCKACHGPSGKSEAGLIPSLAGMNPKTIYKQLEDFRKNRRSWRDMNQIARLLSPQDMADLAAYWAAQPEFGKPLKNDQASRSAKLVNEGNDRKGLPACIACHGPQGNEFGVPSLAGQQAVYIEHQLVSFANGSRRNDLDGQMRDIASHLSREERHAIAVYLSGGRP